jgi:dTDP-4-dehydrorhamnose 3,5-epimerase
VSGQTQISEKLTLLPTRLEGLKLLEPRCFTDSRGFFMELYNRSDYQDVGIADQFVQTNLSRSVRGVIRGIHFQRRPFQMSKLVFCPQGEMLDVVVDLRVGSPTFGQWQGFILSEENRRLLYVPHGFGHGFCALSEQAMLLYQCDALYNPAYDAGIAWNDPDVAIQWPLDQIGEPILSAKDQQLPRLAELMADAGDPMA